MNANLSYRVVCSWVELFNQPSDIILTYDDFINYTAGALFRDQLKNAKHPSGVRDKVRIFGKGVVAV